METAVRVGVRLTSCQRFLWIVSGNIGHFGKLPKSLRLEESDDESSHSTRQRSEARGARRGILVRSTLLASRERRNFRSHRRLRPVSLVYRSPLCTLFRMPRLSRRVEFPSDSGSGRAPVTLAGILDHPVDRDPIAVAVFSHCFTCNKDLKAIVRLSRSLAENGIAVLRYDMTGLGGSQGDFSQSSFTTNRLDLIAAIDFARHELGTVDVLMGHSFGGAASLSVAREPTVVESLHAVISLAAPSDTQHLAKLLSHMNPTIESDGRGEVSIGGRTWTITREMLADFRSHDLTRAISTLSVPALVLHSPVDETVSFDHAIRIEGLIRGSGGSVSVVSLEGADHLLARDPNDLVYVSDLMTAFIKRHATGRG